MSLLLKKAKSLLPVFLDRLTIRRESGPLDSPESLGTFVSTRAAFMAQKTLYGYLKTRMGTRYPSMFEDAAFVASIDIAKLHVYAACLSDLSLYAAACALAGSQATEADCRGLALACFERGLADNAEAAAGVEAFSPVEAKAAFERRLAFWDWVDGPKGADIFSESPVALVRWAPIAPELKQFDREIVENSLKFKWRDARRDFERRLDGAAVAAALTGPAPLPA
jgi:hypothetical protein